VVAFGRDMSERTYNFDGTIPRTRTESVFGYEVPMNGKDFAVVLLPGLHRKLVQGNIKELDGPIARSDYDLVLVGFGPGKVIERVLGIKP